MKKWAQENMLSRRKNLDFCHLQKDLSHKKHSDNNIYKTHLLNYVLYLILEFVGVIHLFT